MDPPVQLFIWDNTVLIRECHKNQGPLNWLLLASENGIFQSLPILINRLPLELREKTLNVKAADDADSRAFIR